MTFRCCSRAKAAGLAACAERRDRTAIAPRLAYHIEEGKPGKPTDFVIIGNQDGQHHGDGRRGGQAGKRAKDDADKGSKDDEPDGIVIAEKGDEAAKNIFKHDALDSTID